MRSMLKIVTTQVEYVSIDSIQSARLHETEYDGTNLHITFADGEIDSYHNVQNLDQIQTVLDELS